MRIADGLEVLEISANIMGTVQTIYPTLFWTNEDVILVDTGFPGQLPLFRDAFLRVGQAFAKLQRVVLTHQDIDHIGGLPAMVAELPPLEIMASLAEKPFIQGDQRLLKMTDDAIERAMRALPPELPEDRRRAFRAGLEHPPTATVHRTIAGGDLLPYCGGILVLDTPGHTPGHISLYHPISKTLIAGDALTVAGGNLAGPNPQATLDLDLARASLRHLADYDVATVVCYHGGVYRGDANQRIAELASRG